jgi:hypothetical protein
MRCDSGTAALWDPVFVSISPRNRRPCWRRSGSDWQDLRADFDQPGPLGHRQRCLDSTGVKDEDWRSSTADIAVSSTLT